MTTLADCAPLFVAAGLLAAGCTGTPPRDVGHVDPDPFARAPGEPFLGPLDAEWQPPEPEPPSFDPPLDEPGVRLPDDEVVSLDLRGTELSEAIHMIAEIAGVNILLDASAEHRVDASFPSIRLDQALDVLLRRNGLILDRLGEDVYYARASDEKVETTARFPLTAGRAETVAAGLKELLGPDVTLSADLSRNVVILTAPRGRVRRAAEYVAAVDRPRSQVLIEVGIYEASIDDRFELGVSFDAAKTVDGNTLGILQAFQTPDQQFSLTFDNAAGTVSSTIQALRAQVGIELLSSPRVMTASRAEARVEILERVPYVNVTSTTTGTTGGVGSTVQEEVQFEDAGVTLVVTPIVQDDGVIEVQVDQTVSEVVEFFKEIPVIDERHLQSTFFVADGETVVMGGLMQDRRDDSEQGVPLVSKIPVFGQLFKKQEKRTEKRELLVFLTPRVLDPAQARAAARLYRDRYREERRRMGLSQVGEEPWWSKK